MDKWEGKQFILQSRRTRKKRNTDTCQTYRHRNTNQVFQPNRFPSERGWQSWYCWQKKNFVFFAFMTQSQESKLYYGTIIYANKCTKTTVSITLEQWYHRHVQLWSNLFFFFQGKCPSMVTFSKFLLLYISKFLLLYILQQESPTRTLCGTGCLCVHLCSVVLISSTATS